MKKTIELALALTTCLILVGQAEAGQSLLVEDFSSDPGWISTDPTNVRWDSNGFYRARVNDDSGVARWGFSPLFQQVANSSFTLDFDMRPASTSWGTYPLLGLIQDGVATPYEVASLRIEAHWSGDGYNKFLLGSNGAPRIGWSPTFDTSKWYNHSIEYDADSNTVLWNVTDLDTGQVFHADTFSGISIAPFNQLAVGYEGAAPVYGSWAEIYVDNIDLVPEPFTLSLLVLGGLAVFRRRRSC